MCYNLCGEMMKHYLKQKLLLIGLMIFFYYAIELIAFLWIGFQPFPISFFVDFIFILLVSLVILVIPSTKWSLIYMSGWLLFVNGLFVTNANIFSVYFELFTLEQFKLLGEATDILNLDYMYIPAFIVFFIVVTVYVYTIKFLRKKNKIKQVHFNGRHYLIAIGIYLVSTVSLVLTFSAFDIDTFGEFNEDVTLTTLKRESMKRYGLLAYYYKEAELIYFNGEFEDPFQMPENPSEPSEYFGLLNGYNVFTIMIESGEEYAINEILTPNLYQMTQDGLYLSSHYSENKTNVAELIGIIGHYPPNAFDTETYNFTFESSLPHILNDQYETAYFHDNYPVFYGRGEVLDMVGFENLYFHDQIYDGAPRWEWDGNLTLDSDTASAMLELMFQSDDPFYYYWTTLVTHGPYNEGDINRQKFHDLGYYDLMDLAETSGDWVNPIDGYTGDDKDELIDQMRYYQAAMMDFDRALGILMQALEDQGELDETLFILYGDHTAYYEKFNQIVLGNDELNEPYYEMDLYSTLYLIYNEHLTQAYLKDHQSQVIQEFSSPYTIVPTVLDLLGIQYNENFMLGSTIFHDLEHVFYSNKLTTFFTDKLYSDNGQDIIYEKGYISDTYLEEFRFQSQQIIDKLQLINDYYQSSRQEKDN
jgi:phosphoglycerol transferase MdoB-like AlkP superfamily enzyme